MNYEVEADLPVGEDIQHMCPLLIKISKDFATLWTTIDPIGNVALFAAASPSRADLAPVVIGNA